MKDLNAQLEIMRSGVMYNDLTAELIGARQRAVLLADEYNRSFGQAPEVRHEILARLLGKVQADAHFEPTFRCEFGFNIEVGAGFYANFDCIILDGAPVTIGDNVLFGPRVGIYTANHSIDARERAAGACVAKPVRIGDRVWVGGGVTINQGVTIGDESIIGAGSVVTKDVPAGVICAGVPARVIREITSDDITGYQGDA